MSNIPPNRTAIRDIIYNLVEDAVNKNGDDEEIEVLEDDLLDDIIDEEIPIEDIQEDEEIPIEEIIEEVEEDEEEEDEIGSKQNPTIKFMGREYDRDTATVGFVIIFLWVLIWKYTGLYKTLMTEKNGQHDLLFTFIFLIFIVYVLLNIGTSGTSSGGVVYELNILLTVEQMISILFGTVVLFTLFGKNLPVHENCQPVVFKLMMSIVIILSISSLWVNVWTSGRTFRALRKFKQQIYNIALTLFITVGLIFVKGGQCKGNIK